MYNHHSLNDLCASIIQIAQHQSRIIIACMLASCIYLNTTSLVSLRLNRLKLTASTQEFRVRLASTRNNDVLQVSLCSSYKPDQPLLAAEFRINTLLTSALTATHPEPLRAIEPLPAPPKSIMVYGRTGSNSVINGKYNIIPNQIAGKPAYQSDDGKLFLYSHPSNPAWLIGKKLGDTTAPAYAASAAPAPHLISVRNSLHIIGICTILMMIAI